MRLHVLVVGVSSDAGTSSASTGQGVKFAVSLVRKNYQTCFVERRQSSLDMRTANFSDEAGIVLIFRVFTAVDHSLRSV